MIPTRERERLGLVFSDDGEFWLIYLLQFHRLDKAGLKLLNSFVIDL